MYCELCGAKIDQSIQIEIEGASLEVCSKCSSLGKIVSKKMISSPVLKTQELVKNMSVQEAKDTKNYDRIFEQRFEIILGFGKIIKDAREHLNIKQSQLAKMLAEKESLIHAIENEKHKPDEKLCKKIEKILSIKLLERKVSLDDGNINSNTDSTNVTIGDMIKIKKR